MPIAFNPANAAHLYGYRHDRNECLRIAAKPNLRFYRPVFLSWHCFRSTVLVVYVG